MSVLGWDVSQVIKLARDLGLAAQMMPMASEEALEKAGQMVHDEAREAAPVDTGRLRDSIYLRRNKASRKIGTTVYYGIFQEFGTSKMGPQPWLYPAAREGQNALARSVLDAGTDIL